MTLCYSYKTWAHQYLKKQVKSLSTVLQPLRPPRWGIVGGGGGGGGGGAGGHDI